MKKRVDVDVSTKLGSKEFKITKSFKNMKEAIEHVNLKLKGYKVKNVKCWGNRTFISCDPVIRKIKITDYTGLIVLGRNK